MALKPHIYHIVGHTEAHHAATADDIIEASKIVRRVITNAMGAPDMTMSRSVQEHKEALISEAQITLGAIRYLAPRHVEDPWSDAHTLAQAVITGILDAPQLKNNKFAKGTIKTRIAGGSCLAVDENDLPIKEALRLSKLV
jgi:hypothetical protein